MRSPCLEFFTAAGLLIVGVSACRDGDGKATREPLAPASLLSVEPAGAPEPPVRPASQDLAFVEVIKEAQALREQPFDERTVLLVGATYEREAAWNPGQPPGLD
jgi:hypothetical protein